jgi:hypothetical protein
MHPALHAFHQLHHFVVRHLDAIVAVLLMAICVAILGPRLVKRARRLLLLVLALAPTAEPALAQSESHLKAYFEGRTVAVKLEMPGAADGVDVYPGAMQAIDFSRHARRLKQFGTAYRRGDEALVTKIKVKRDLIEFQLGGGGYGTFDDDVSSYVVLPLTPKTEREKNLEQDVKRTTDPAELRRMREELDALRRDRQREDVRNQADAIQAEQLKEGNLRQRRIEGGSRFNIRYPGTVPPEGLTPEGVMHVLEQYLDFAPR